MEKIVLQFAKNENSIVTFDGQDIQVVPYIDGALGAFLIDQYIREYFYSSTDEKILPSVLRNYLGARIGICASILKRIMAKRKLAQ